MMKEKCCLQCLEIKPIELFRVSRKENRGGVNPRCKDCLNWVQKQMPYPILKQPSREWVLAELVRIKSIDK